MPSETGSITSKRDCAPDVIRGIAILFIVLYHASSQILPYGYHGVSIFLVISGYYIFKGLQKQDYTAWSYLKRRISRILIPLAISIILALILLIATTPLDCITPTAKTALAAILGISNLYLEQNSNGYFAADTLSNGMIHTWYTSVIIQIYLLFVAGHFILSKLPKSIAIAITIIIACFSLLWGNQVFITVLLQKLGFNPPFHHLVSPDSMYYQTLPRLWIVLAGCGIAYLPKIHKSIIIEIIVFIGLLLVFVPTCMHRETAKILALPVVAGTALLIRYLPDSKTLGKIINLPVLSWLGRISFSLFLIHVPLLVIYRSISGNDHVPAMHLLPCLASILLCSWLFYYFVESKSLGKCQIGCILALCLGLSSASILCEDSLRLIHKEANSVSHVRYSDFGECKSPELLNDYPNELMIYWDGVYRFTCQPKAELNTTLFQIGDGSKAANFILLGDCQAHTLYAGLHECCKAEGLSGVFSATYMPAFWNRLSKTDDGRIYTQEKAEAMLQWLAKHPEIKHVIIAQLWSYWMPPATMLQLCWDGTKHPDNTLESAAQDLGTLCKKLKDINKNVILLNEVPTISANNPIKVIRGKLCFGKHVNADNLLQSKTEYRIKNAPYRQCLEQLQSQGLCTLLHTADVHLENGRFSAWKDGKVLMFDTMHQTYPAALITAMGIMPQLREILNSSP